MNKNDKESPSQEIVKLATDAGLGALSLVEPVSGAIATIVSNSIRKAADIRAQHFLLGLEKHIQTDGDADSSDYFYKLKDSDILSEMLMDYVRAAINSPSPTARSAMALIYYRYYKTGKEPDYFTKTAMKALMQITDEEIALFIALTDLEKIRKLPNTEKVPILSEQGAYPVVFFGGTFEEYLLSTESLSGDDVVSVIHKLINFNILQDDHYIGRFGGVNCPYGVNRYALKLRGILIEAQSN